MRRRRNRPQIVIDTSLLRRSFDFSNLSSDENDKICFKQSSIDDEADDDEESQVPADNNSYRWEDYGEYSSQFDETYTATKSISNIMNETLNVELILRDIGLVKYCEKFVREEIDMFVFSMLTESDLVELNIDGEDRETILKAVELYSDCYTR